jgi:hypothetical protein
MFDRIVIRERRKQPVASDPTVEFSEHEVLSPDVEQQQRIPDPYETAECDRPPPKRPVVPYGEPHPTGPKEPSEAEFTNQQSEEEPNAGRRETTRRNC